MTLLLMALKGEISGSPYAPRNLELPETVQLLTVAKAALPPYEAELPITKQSVTRALETSMLVCEQYAPPPEPLPALPLVTVNPFNTAPNVRYGQRIVWPPSMVVIAEPLTL